MTLAVGVLSHSLTSSCQHQSALNATTILTVRCQVSIILPLYTLWFTTQHMEHTTRVGTRCVFGDRGDRESPDSEYAKHSLGGNSLRASHSASGFHDGLFTGLFLPSPTLLMYAVTWIKLSAVRSVTKANFCS